MDNCSLFPPISYAPAVLIMMGPYQNYLLNVNNQKNSIFFRPLFSALVALLRFACPGALAQLSHSTQFVLQYRAVTERNQTTRFISKKISSNRSVFPNFLCCFDKFLSMPRNQMSALWIIVQWSSAEEKSTIERIHGKLPVFKSLVGFFFYIQVF